MFFLYVCYSTIFLLILVISLTHNLKRALFFFVLGILFYTIIFYLTKGYLLSGIYIQSILLYLFLFLITGYIQVSLRKKVLTPKEVLEYQDRSLPSYLEFSPVAIINCNQKGVIKSLNITAQKVFGYRKEEIRTKDLSFLLGEEEDFTIYLEKLGQGEILEGIQLTGRRQDDSKFNLMLKTIPLSNEVGENLGAMHILLDPSKAKKNQERPPYYNSYDQMTGLYNRVFIEEEIKRLNREKKVPISVILGDINGLRLINDAFGHTQGNRVLQAVANLLKETCREGDIIGRWGADEFILLLTDISYQEAESICSRLRSSQLQSILPIPVSLALTFNTKRDPKEDLEEIVRVTEDLLYKEHQGLIQYARDTILSTMLKMLSSVSDETEEHNWRMQRLAIELGEGINLSEIELERLSLLVSLHDIGKITVDKDILLKRDICSQIEFGKVKTHCEAGYFIAHSSGAFSHVADDILAHHEWWDGSSYPRGLRGGEIPIISRILTIIDAFDTMTKKRRYGNILSQEEALWELKRNAGTQFDPHLTDLFVSFMNKNGLNLQKKDNRIQTRPITAEEQLKSSYEQIQALSRRLLHAQEEEITRVARDLHDDIGQNLTALKLDLELLNGEISSKDAKLKKRMEITIHLVDGVIDHIRHQISSLRPPVLDDIGLLAAIQGIIDRYSSSTSIKIFLHEEGMDQRFSREVETVLYRCIQEALTNVVRHSRASKVKLDLIFNSREITVHIRDNGCGFHLERLAISTHHIGLTGMKERVQLINGQITIQSEPGQGTEIFISVPVK